jgi:hypothetical protein
MLLLRKECQPILDKNKLSDLHVTNESGNLALAGECGQPIVIVHGISFSKKAINSKEREYAVELFEKFISKYKYDIQSYIGAKKKFKEFDIKSYDKYKNVQIQINSYAPQAVRVQINCKEEICTIDVLKNKLRFMDELEDDKFVELMKKYSKEIKYARGIIDDFNRIVEEERKLNNLKIKLSHCDI